VENKGGVSVVSDPSEPRIIIKLRNGEINVRTEGNVTAGFMREAAMVLLATVLRAELASSRGRIILRRQEIGG